MEFEKLLTQISDRALLEEIIGLVEKKKSGIEPDIEPKRALLNNFIEDRLHYFENTVKSFEPRKTPKQGLLEEAFIKIVSRT
jgi:predicted nucleotidyltransferase